MPENLRSTSSGIVSVLLRSFAQRVAPRGSNKLDLDLERGLKRFSRADQQKIRAYLALNPGDQAFIRTLTKK